MKFNELCRNSKWGNRVSKTRGVKADTAAYQSNSSMYYHHKQKPNSSLSCYTEGTKKKNPRKFRSCKKYVHSVKHGKANESHKSKSKDKHDSQKKNKMTIDNKSIMLSSCGSKNLEDSLGNKKVIFTTNLKIFSMKLHKNLKLFLCNNLIILLEAQDRLKGYYNK